MLTIRSILDEYTLTFPDERERLSPLTDLVENSSSDGEIFSRKNFIGHITASGFVISNSKLKVLLLYHKTLRKFLQPGGHIEIGESSPLEAAIREIKEETSITSLNHLPFHFDDQVPIDIDTHPIPENKLKNEPAHWHHDFRYLFICKNENQEVNIDNNESIEYQWIDISELKRLQNFLKIAEKIQKALSGEFCPKKFYNNLFSRFVIKESKLSAIVVAHFLPDVPVYLMSLNKFATIKALIPKPKSIVKDVYDTLKPIFPVQEVTREVIQTTNLIVQLVEAIETKVVLFDIGGYFAPLIENLVHEFPEKIVGIIEDTENGHQRYESLNYIPCSVYSVARSPLKSCEDFLVGQSILYSADAILREVGKLIQYLTCSVIGFGKIGSSIAYHLLLRGIKPAIFDIDPIRRLEAYNRLYFIPERKYIIQCSDVIFCATGQRCLDILDFRQLKPGCFIFTVTSSDDEINLKYLNSEYSRKEVAPHITMYSNVNNYFYLVNNGNAVNFIHKGVLGNFIHLVRGEMIVALHMLLSSNSVCGMNEVTPENRCEIAEIWMNIFVEDKVRYTHTGSNSL